MTMEIFLIGAGVVDVLVRPAEREVFDTGSYSAQEITMSTGGDALNEATVLARLGRKPKLCTLFGRDAAGAFLEEHCRRHGISLDYAAREELPTGVNVVLVQKDGERNFLTNPSSTLRNLELRHIPEHLPKEVGIVALASIFVSPKLGISQMKELFARVKAQGKILCADMTKRKNGETLKEMKEVLSYVDYLLPNAQEAALLTGEENPERSAELLLGAGVKNVAVKAGKKGCYIRNASLGRWVPAVSGITCVDTTGAGDCFAAGFLYGISRGFDLETCARWGNACGSLAAEHVGATEGIRDLAQVEERLRLCR